MQRPSIVQILLLSLFSLLTFHHTASAQTCGAKEVNERLLIKHPEYKNEATNLRQEIRDRIVNQSAQRGGVPMAIFTIPVVVHVIHLGETVGNGSNISATQIQNAITSLNSRFANSNGLGVNIGIDFCLAVRDPNGNPTTGINRVNGSSINNFTSQGIEWDGSGGASELDVKLLSIWPRDQYYNIWVVHSIYGAVAGYAYYPTTYPIEGMVIESGYMTSGSTVLTHEMGHAFDLAHTFEGDNDNASCPPNANCAVDGDQVCDTPPHKRTDCAAICSASGTYANSLLNYMNYNYCGSTDRFTAGQQDRMEAAVNSSLRSSLLTSLGCVASTCSTACSDANPCTYNLCTAGACSFPAISCNDNDACTNDICNNFDCFNIEIDCSDADDCTVDYCSNGCVNQLADCSDGDACTEDFCDAGACYNELIDCSDANPCTDDACEQQTTNIYLDYDALDEVTQPGGATYTRLLWGLNSHFAETNGNHNKLQWGVTRFNWLQDANTLQNYSYSENTVTVDSLDIYFAHQKGAGAPDTILVTIYEDNGGIAYDNQDNILNNVLYVDTIVTSVSLSPNVNTPVALRVKPELSLGLGQQFMVGVHFYGRLTSTFNVVAGYGNRCGGCVAYPLFTEDNSWWKLIFFDGTTNRSGINHLFYNCNLNGSFDRANCEGFYLQNLAIGAYLTLTSHTDYACVNTPAACLVNISGIIRTEANIPIPGVTVTLSGDATGSVVTGSNGLYSFQVPSGGNYTITPSKNNDVTTNNGVTTGDITLIRRHILGSSSLSSPYKVIAADGTGNGGVATSDISTVRSVILTGTSKFPNGRLWEFVSSSQVFTGPPYNPFPFTKTRTYTNLTQTSENQNFIGMKLGDVNNTWNASTP